MYLAEDTEKWRAFVNTIINRGVSQIAGNFLSNGLLLGSQEGLCSKELVTKIY